jgi:hypothetical protein
MDSNERREAIAWSVEHIHLFSFFYPHMEVSMRPSDMVTNAMKFVKANNVEILTGLGVAGIAATGFLSAKAGHQAAEVIFMDDLNREDPIPTDKKERAKELSKLTWKCYIPAIAVGALTSVCVVGATRSSAKRTAAAVAAYSVAERAFTEYREKVVEQIGEKKEEKLRAELAQSRVDNAPPKDSQVIVTGKGDVLCCEAFTGRYFRCDMEILRRAENDINAKIIRELYVTLDEFYYLVGLRSTTTSSNAGWDSDKGLMELEFHSALTAEGEPCLVFDYNYVKSL